MSNGYISARGGKWHRAIVSEPTFTRDESSACGLAFRPLNVTWDGEQPPTTARHMCQRAGCAGPEQVAPELSAVSRQADVIGGLSVRRSPGTAPGWRVVHALSGLDVGVTMRLQAEARDLRAALLASGCDFTVATAREVQGDPASRDARAVAASWLPRSLYPQARQGPRMAYFCVRNSDGTTHVTNMLEGLTGQHHVHDRASWQAWRATVSTHDDDFTWAPDGTDDCMCGQPSWQPVAKGR